MIVAAMEQALKLRTCVIEELRIPQNDAVHPISYAGHGGAGSGTG